MTCDRCESGVAYPVVMTGGVHALLCMTCRNEWRQHLEQTGDFLHLCKAEAQLRWYERSGEPEEFVTDQVAKVASLRMTVAEVAMQWLSETRRDRDSQRRLRIASIRTVLSLPGSQPDMDTIDNAIAALEEVITQDPRNETPPRRGDHVSKYRTHDDHPLCPHCDQANDPIDELEEAANDHGSAQTEIDCKHCGARFCVEYEVKREYWTSPLDGPKGVR